MIKFLSLDTENRTATFDVDGTNVTRNIPEYFEGTIDEYIQALASGLAIEFAETEIKEITAPTIAPGSELA